MSQASLCGYAVEWVRSCYQSQWKLRPDDNTYTLGRYCFAPDDTPHFPRFHSFGSRNYTTDDYTEAPLTGERRGTPQKWHSGLAPDPFPAAIQLGSDDQLGEGGGGKDIIGPVVITNGFDQWSTVGEDMRFDYRQTTTCGGASFGAGNGDFHRVVHLASPKRLTVTLTARLPVQATNALVDFTTTPPTSELHITPNGPFTPCVMGDYSASLTVDIPAGDTTLQMGCIDAGFGFDAGGFARFHLEWEGEPPQPCVEMYDGFPLACYHVTGQEGELLRRTPDVTDTADQLGLIKIIVDLYANPATAEASLQAFMGPEADVIAYGDTPGLVPGSVIGKRDDVTVVCCTGTTNFFQAACYSLYSLIGPIDYGDFSTNAVWRIAASTVHSRLSAFGVSPDSPVILAGHSYGGALVCCLAGMYAAANPDRRIDVVSYGGAKPGDERLRQLLAKRRVIRVSNIGDPVPALPPTYAAAIPYIPVLPFAPDRVWQPFLQPRGGWLVDVNGVKTETEDTPLSFAYLAQVIQSIVTGPPLTTPFAHFSSEYVRRLELALALEGQP